MIDNKAPIIPWDSIGGIKLYSSFRDLKDVVKDRRVKAVLLNNMWVRYEIENTLYLFFHLLNGKVFKITTLSGYTGKLFGTICVGMTEKELLASEPSFSYDEFEEVYESPKGVFIETSAETGNVEGISVYIKEIDNDDFEDCNW